MEKNGLDGCSAGREHVGRNWDSGVKLLVSLICKCIKHMMIFRNTLGFERDNNGWAGQSDIQFKMLQCDNQMGQYNFSRTVSQNTLLSGSQQQLKYIFS